MHKTTERHALIYAWTHKVVGPEVMPLRLSQRRHLEVAQVPMVSVMAPVRRRADEECADYLKRKRRTARAKIPRYLLWSVAQKRRFLICAGHVACLDENRWVRKVVCHRSLGEWRTGQAMIGDSGESRHPWRHRRPGVRPCRWGKHWCKRLAGTGTRSLRRPSPRTGGRPTRVESGGKCGADFFPVMDPWPTGIVTMDCLITASR